MMSANKKKRAPRRKHVPQRSCVICREVHPKRELIRLVYNPEDGLVIDPTGKLPGRGAYLCGKPDCWQKAATSGVLSKALKTTLIQTDRDRVMAYHNEHISHASAAPDNAQIDEKPV